MGTFLAPLPSPEHIFASTNDPEFSSILAALLTMTDDDDVGAGEPPRVVDESFAPTDYSTALPSFFDDQHDTQAATPFPAPVSLLGSPPSHVPVDAAHHEGTVGTSRPAKDKRKRGWPTTSSPGGPSRARVASSRRRVWVRERSTEWWDRLDSPTCPDAEFRRAFRMSRTTFTSLVDALGGAVAKEDTTLRAAVPARRRVAACVWRLATAEPLREVSRRFGLGISTCHNIVLQVCRALAAAVLTPSAAIRWPDDDPAAGLFHAASGLPGVVGAVCTTRVPIVTPRENAAAYYDGRLTERRNGKPSYSVAVQAVSDAGGALSNVYVGLPGSLSDAAAVLGRSTTFCARRRGEAGGGLWLGQDQRLVGGASYPLTDTEWMLVPYADHGNNNNNLTWAELEFNGRVAAARGVARGAVRRLKARWRCLQQRTEVKLRDLPSMIAACCVLHNICEGAGEGIDPELIAQYDELDDDDNVIAHHGAANRDLAFQF
ncbi:unnamed protein product [Urochloa humidicola]